MNETRHTISCRQAANGIHVSNAVTSILTIFRTPCIVLCFCTLLLNTSCTGSSPGNSNGVASAGGNKPPVIHLAKILDDPIHLDHPIEIQIDAQDPEREAVSFQYQWYVDNAPVPKQTSPTLPAELLSRGQTVFVEIIPLDSANKGQPYRTKSVVVGNTSPKVTAVSFISQNVRAGDRFEAQVEASDPDHDRVDLTYRWYRNDVVIKDGEEAFLDTAGFTGRDRILVEVVARDPSGLSHSMKSDTYVLGNSAPHIVSSPPIAASQDRYDYSVKAVDPDGDRLTYQLEVAPPGMTIGVESGHIVWQIPSDQQGTFHVKVAAKDGAGGLATQEFDVTLTLVSPATPSGA